MLKNLIRPPFCYIGAKTKLLEWIYSFFPEHTTFVDVFGIYMDYKNFYQGNEVEWLENAMKERIDFIMAGGDVWDFLV